MIAKAPTIAVPPAQLSPEEQARQHLLALHKHGLGVGEWIELRCLDCRQKPARSGPRHYLRSATDTARAAMSYRDRWDVFIGIGLRKCPATHDINRCPHETRGEDHISRLPAAWADLDVACEDQPNKPHGSVDEALARVTAADPAADLAVASGAGLHAYWLFAQPTTELERVERLNRALRGRFQGDNAVDASRILRLAGTFNHKHGASLPVTLMRCGHE